MLTGSGFLPGDPGSRHRIGKHKIVERHGPAVEFGGGGAARGYELREEDGEEYNLYVVELYERVHQRVLREGLLPLHFLRGLAVEREGEQVNWVGFAMARCFPTWKRTAFVPMDKFANVNTPYPFLHKRVLPLPDPVRNVRGAPTRGQRVSAIDIQGFFTYSAVLPEISLITVL